jgi:lysophospholipase L1-like esterase
MKKILTLILLLSSLLSNAQTYIHKDTTFLGYMARISYIEGKTDSTNLILVMHGNGEVGTTTNKSQVYGPHYWFNNGWNGAVVLGNGTHYPVYVTLQQPATYTRPWTLKSRIDAIKTRFKVKYGGLHAMGLSGGGWCWQQVATYKPTSGDLSYYSILRSVINIQGVRADDTYDATLAYPNKFGNAAKNSELRYVGFEQVLDNRGISTVVKNINDSVAGRAYMYWTNFGASGHTNFNDFYNPSQTNWTLTNPDVQLSNGGATNTIPFAGGQNIYQWALRQSADTSISSAASVIVNSGAAQTINLPTSTVTLTGSASGGTAPYSYSWTRISGPNTPTIVSPTSTTTVINGLELGTYIFRLTATDNVGTIGSSNVSITVTYSNSELSITSNSPTTTTGTASLTSTLSPNHNIVSTKWSKLSGPTSTPKKLVFIGSSTTAGYGSTGYVSGTTSDSSYVGRVLKYYNDLGILTTTAGVNLGQSTTDIYQAQPSWYVPPVGRNSPLAGRNITAALALSPDVIIVNYPSNSYDFLTVTETMAAFRRIKATVDSANKIVFFTTCQPRPGFAPSEELKLIQFSDSIRAQFPNNYIEFYNPLADETNPQAFVPAYDFGDNVHTNDAGHKQLARQVIATNVFKSFVTSESTISTPTTANTNVTGLTVGQHRFQVSIEDTRGLAATSISTANMVATPCNEDAPVTYTISQTSAGEIYRPNGSAWKGGDTIKITGTNYTVIEFFNIRGDACRPIIIMPQTTTTTRQFRLKGNSSYIKIWGGPTQYGLKIIADPSLNIGAGLSFERVHHAEADNIEISGQNTGVSFKENVVYADTLTWYPRYVMQKFKFTNIYVHDIDGEGFYVGNTLPTGYTVTSPYTGDTVIVGNRIDSVEISNSLVERTTWDGIQLSNARNGNKIFNNVVRNFGTLDLDGQRAGIILGSNTNGDVYNNIVENGTGNGIQVFGYGSIKLYGNTVTNVGNTTNNVNGEQSIYGSDYVTTPETNPKQAVEIYNNQINQPKLRGAITFFEANNNAENINVHDNKFCIPGATGSWQSTYLTLPPVATNINNVLFCAAISTIKKLRGLIRFKNN